MKLKRELGLLETTLYGVGIILGAGIYVLIGEAVGIAGNSAWLAFLIGAIVSSFTGLSYAELSTMFPKAAAEYVYVRKASHSKFLAYILGWLIISTGVISASTVALGFAGYFESLFGFSRTIIVFLLLAALSFVTFLGIRESARFNIILTAVEIFGLIIIIFLGLPLLGKVDYLESPQGLGGILSAAALIFFAYIGFEDIANISEETKNPRKTLPKALILAILITTILYVFTAISVVNLANWEDLSRSDAPLALAASSILGGNAFTALSIIALFATANTILGVMIVTTRMMYGMANEKSLPKNLTTLHKKRRTPWIAILIVMVFSMIFSLFGDVTVVASITSLTALITFSAVNLSLIWLRLKMPNAKRAFKVPLNIGKYPLPAFLGFLLCMVMIFQFEFYLLLIGATVITVGALVYIGYRRFT